MSFPALDEAISKSLKTDPQEWGDYLVLEADALVRSFKDHDWELLAAQWKNRSEGWQLRCADVLDTEAGTPILLTIIVESTPAVALAAARSLQMVLTGRPERLIVSRYVVDRIRALSLGSDRWLSKVFQKLLRIEV